MILRTIRGYAIEWHYRYFEGNYFSRLDEKKQFEFLPGCFDDCLANNPGISLTMDMNGLPFASTADGTLRIESDDVGLLVTADLLDHPVNRALCRLIDKGRVKGWSHLTRFLPFSLTSITKEGDVTLKSYRKATLSEITLVVHKIPRAKSRKTPIFMEGGPVAKETASVY